MLQSPSEPHFHVVMRSRRYGTVCSAIPRTVLRLPRSRFGHLGLLNLDRIVVPFSRLSWEEERKGAKELFQDRAEIPSLSTLILREFEFSSPRRHLKSDIVRVRSAESSFVRCPGS
eukprot:877094-Rhodomonas_salina.3